MLDDGLPYHIILDELAETAQGLTPQSLAQWLKSGYEDYVKTRQIIEGAKTQAEFATDLLRELGDIDVRVIHRASMHLVALQLFNAIDEYGDHALRRMLDMNPATYPTLLNTLCNVSNANLKHEQRQHRLESDQDRAIG